MSSMPPAGAAVIAYLYAVVVALAVMASVCGVVLLAVEGAFRVAGWWRRG